MELLREAFEPLQVRWLNPVKYQKANSTALQFHACYQNGAGAGCTAPLTAQPGESGDGGGCVVYTAGCEPTSASI